MDSTNTKSNAATPPTRSDHETSLNAHSVGKVVLHPSGQKTLSHSSSTGSSPDSPLDDPFNSDDDDNESFSSNESPHKREHIPASEPNVGPGNDSVMSTEAPCCQTMERAESSAYRIPPSVFGSNTAAGDWSVASNESLFSIHGGNVSFRNESFWRSGDLGVPGHQPSTSDHMFIYSAKQPRSCTESIMSHELGLAQATMKEVIMESELNHPCGNHHAKTLAEASRSSHGRSTSTKSFAFSIKAEESQRGGLSRAPSSVRSIPDEHAPSSEQTAARRNSQYPTQPPQVATEPPTHHRDQKTDPANSGAHPKKWQWYFFARCSLW